MARFELKWLEDSVVAFRHQLSPPTIRDRTQTRTPTCYDFVMAEDQKLAPLVEALTLDTRFAAAILFGSVARGTARPGSDIDIAVLFAGEAARSSASADLIALFGQLGLTAHRDVHLIDLERVDSALRRSIFGTGRTLFDRSGRRLSALNAATLLEYFDWAYARRVIDEGHRRRLGHAGG